MRPDCERCGCELLPDADALICSFECTFCTEHDLTACPNCGGALERRPTRTVHLIARYPASSERKYKA